MMVAAHESAARAEAARREALLRSRVADLEAEIEQLRADGGGGIVGSGAFATPMLARLLCAASRRTDRPLPPTLDQ